MFVKSVMKPKHECFIAGIHDTLYSVLHTLQTEDIEAMPVVEDNIFKGMVTKQLIYEAFFKAGDVEKDRFLKTSTVKDIADYEKLYINEDDVFEETLTNFKGFPVLAVTNEKHQFVGIVTRFDTIEQFQSAFGMKREGIRIAFTSIEAEGRIPRLAELIKHYQENVISLATFDETDKMARRIVLKVEKKDNIKKFIDKLEKSGFRILDVKEM
ncbi:CBS domain-containing protein [Salirhabdus salicampi]|uniref:CBS domain-containing protein n=1 Tax=Salirhabdus salicampi TaxID=476102 RepID=UPI0020C47670|nr:CBS domain-containing protein [Salirhabdus salicampi]MCP8616727.1 hypothetical protein [Salirhabdus salicampi]